MTHQDFYAKYNIDPDSISWAGKGDFGEAYFVNADRVLKKTTAISEFDIAKQLVDNTSSAFNVVAKVYAAELVDGEKWILMEELELDSDIEDYFYQVRDHMEQQGLPIQYTHLMDWDETTAPDDVKEFADKLDDINRAYRMLGIEASDMRPENMGYDKNGTLKAFDLHDKSIGEVRKLVRECLLERFGFNNNKTFTPPENVKATVRRALAGGSQAGHGGNEGSGQRKAQELANGGIQSHAQMKRLKAFFDANQPGSPEWELHGGNAAKMWVDRSLAGNHDANMRTKENMRKVGGGGYGMNDGMGSMSATMMKTNNNRNHSVWTRAKNRQQNAKNEAVVDKNGNLLGFSSGAEEAEEFHIQWDMWLQEQAGETIEGFTLTFDGMFTQWVGQDDDYTIDAEIFPRPSYESEMEMMLLKQGTPHYINIAPLDKELMFDSGPDRVWEAYSKNLREFIQEAKRQGKFLDI